MLNRFVLNEVSYFGPGAREVLPQEVKRLGLHKAFVASDKDLIKFGVTGKVLEVLDKAGIPYEVFSDIKPNPTVANVNQEQTSSWPSAEVRPSTLRKPSASSRTTLSSATWCRSKA